MAILELSASGASTSDGSANLGMVLALSASAASASAGSASITIVSGTQVTQAGVTLDVSGTVPAQVTQAGVTLDVSGTVPAQVTQAGVTLDVDRTVPAQVTQAGVTLDVDRIVPARVSTMGLLLDARYSRPRTLTMCWEFHVYTRGGTYLTYLDNAFDKTYLAQLWDVGGGSFRLPVDDAKATTTNIRAGNIVRVRYANVDIGAWIMETVGRTFVDTGEGAARIISVSGRGLLGSLQKGLVYPVDIEDPAANERPFVEVPKAEILLTLYDEYVLRGGGIFTTSFTAVKDTTLADWPDEMTLTYRTGQTLLDVLRQLQGFGLEVIAQPDKTLDAFIEAGQDRSSSVVFRYGQNMLACSVGEAGADLANAVLGEGSGILDEDTDAASIATYGRQEAFLPVRNTDSADQVALANEQFLALYGTPPAAIALQVATWPYYPLVDYELGDLVRVVVPGDVEGDYRVLAIALQENTGPCDLRVTLELNSVQAEYLARVQRAMDASLASVPPGTGAASGMASSSTSVEGGGGAFAIDDLTDVNITGTPADNEVLAYDSGSGNWINQTAEEAGLTPDILTTKGDLLTRSSAYGRLPVGTDGQVLTADAAQTFGVTWATPDGGPDNLDDLSDVNAPAPNDGDVLTWDGTESEWVAAAPVAGSGDVATDAIWDAAGDLVQGTGSNTAAKLALGTAGQVLTVNSGATAAEWADVPNAAVDAGDVTYTPTTAADWDGSADPGNVDDALDQLAERVADVEGAAGHDAVTLSAAADTVLSLSTQEIGLDVQSANEVLAGPTTGADAAPAFRALVAADVGTGTPTGTKFLRDDMSWAAQARTMVFVVAGTLTVASSPIRIHAPEAMTVTNVTVAVNTAPTGASLIVDVNKNGTTIFSTQGNRPTIAATETEDLSSVPDVTAIAQNDVVTIDVDQIGSTVAGADLVVQVRCTVP